MEVDGSQLTRRLRVWYNIWQLEEWLAERELSDCGAKETLEPLVQAAQLLQIKKKTEADAQDICSMCTALTMAQILKVLTLYTPVIEFEEQVPTAFITTIKDILKDRGESAPLMMDGKMIFSVTLPFTPSAVALETIQFDLLLKLFEEDEKAKGSTNKHTGVTGRAGPSQKDNKKTVGLQSLHLLMDKLNATSPDYVRCIKPNDDKSPFSWLGPCEGSAAAHRD